MSIVNRQQFSVNKTAFCLAGLVLFVASNIRGAEVIPTKPDRYFNDYAGIVSAGAGLRFNEQLAQFERETSNQVVIAIYPKMESDSDIADYTQRIAQTWGIGQQIQRNGVVLFVFIQDRKMFVQVGYGLEGVLPDITAFDITEYQIKPHFRANDYEGGIAAGIDSILKAIRGEYKGSGKTVRERNEKNTGGLVFFLAFLIMLFIFSRIIRSLGGYGYSSRRGGPIFFPTGGGGWSSGGGGGGFSGFSGGGGSFGGGGAGSSW